MSAEAQHPANDDGAINARHPDVIGHVDTSAAPATVTSRLELFGGSGARSDDGIIKLTTDRGTFRPHADLFREGTCPDLLIVIVAGYACQYKMLKSGVRQVTEILMPGDIDPLSSITGSAIDYSVGALSEVTLARVAGSRMRHLLAERSDTRDALLALLRLSEARLREAMLNVTRRPALERMAFLLLTIWSRGNKAGLVQGGVLHCPLTQSDLADMLGLTAVHVNRTIQKLRASGLVAFRHANLIVPDVEALAYFADARDGER